MPMEDDVLYVGVLLASILAGMSTCRFHQTLNYCRSRDDLMTFRTGTYVCKAF